MEEYSGDYQHTLFAAFSSSDGSPSFREWQDRMETTGAFMVRVQDIIANGGGYLTCDGIYQCTTNKDAALSAAAAGFARTTDG